MEITNRPPHPCLATELGKLLALLKLGECIRIEMCELPGETKRAKMRVLGMRVSRIRRRELGHQMHRNYFRDGYFFVERTA